MLTVHGNSNKFSSVAAKILTRRSMKSSWSMAGEVGISLGLISSQDTFFLRLHHMCISPWLYVMWIICIIFIVWVVGPIFTCPFFITLKSVGVRPCAHALQSLISWVSNGSSNSPSVRKYMIITTVLRFIECWLHAGHSCKHFACTSSCSFHDSSVRKTLLFFHFTYEELEARGG